MPVFKSKRKVQSLGASLVITLPALFTKTSSIKKGSKVNVHYGLDGVLVASNVEDEKVLSTILRTLLYKIYEKHEDLDDS